MSLRPALSAIAASLVGPVVSRYITAERDRLAPRCTALSTTAKHAVAAYFEPATVACVRVVQSNPLPVREPPLTGSLRKVGFDYPGLSSVAGITLDYVIACQKQMSPAILFHEMVHVVQFRLLGVSSFSHHYVAGFLRTGSYREIPLERCAYELGWRFENEHGSFSVESEVKKHLGIQLNLWKMFFGPTQDLSAHSPPEKL